MLRIEIILILLDYINKECKDKCIDILFLCVIGFGFVLFLMVLLFIGVMFYRW